MSGCYQIKLAKKVVGLVRSWYVLALRSGICPQEFFKGLSLRCVTTSRNDKSLLISQFGAGIQPHEHTPKQVLKRAVENDLRFNKQHFGHVLGTDGLETLPRQN